MISSLFQDRRATGLLNRVRQDAIHLRNDIGDLLSHTTRRTLPNGARELADQARHQLSAGGSFAASRLRDLRNHPPAPTTAGLVGGAVVLGLLAVSAYALFRNKAHHEVVEVHDELEGLS